MISIGKITINNRYNSIILDGEMIAYDPSVGGFLPFGTLKSTSQNKEGETVELFDVTVDINDPTKPHPCCEFFFMAATIFFTCIHYLS